MTPLVEKVARAICRSSSCEGVRCCQWPAQGGRMDCPVRHGGYDDAARAAIAVVVGEIGYELCYGCAERLPFNSLGQHERHVRSAITLVPCRAAAIRKILSALSPTTPTGGADD